MLDTYKKIDDNTVEITTTFDLPEPVITTRSKAGIQTELDHITGRLAEAQEQVDAVNKRKAELIEILKVFD